MNQNGDEYDGLHPCPFCDGVPKTVTKLTPPNYCWKCMNTGKLSWVEVMLGGSSTSRMIDTTIIETIKNMAPGLRNKMSGNIPKGSYASKVNIDGSLSISVDVPVTIETIDIDIKIEKP